MKVFNKSNAIDANFLWQLHNIYNKATSKLEQAEFESVDDFRDRKFRVFYAWFNGDSEEASRYKEVALTLQGKNIFCPCRSNYCHIEYIAAWLNKDEEGLKKFNDLWQEWLKIG